MKVEPNTSLRVNIKIRPTFYTFKHTLLLASNVDLDFLGG